MNDETQNSSWRNKRMIIFLGFVTFCLLAVVITVAAIEIIASRNMKKLEAEIRARGEPLTYTEMNDWVPEVADKENGTEWYLLAANKFFDLSDLPDYEKLDEYKNLPVLGEANLPKCGHKPSKKMMDTIEWYLGKNKEALSALEQGIKFNKCRFIDDYRKFSGKNFPYDHLAPMRKMSQLLWLKAYYHAAQGDAQASTQTLLNMCKLANTLDEEPTLISMLVRMAMVGITYKSFANAQMHVKFSEEQLAKMQSAFAGLENPDVFYKSMIGERTFISQLEFSKEGSFYFDDSEIYYVSVRFFLNNNRYEMLRMNSDIVEIAKRPFPERLIKIDAHAKLFPEMPTSRTTYEKALRVRTHISDYLRATYASSFKSDAKLVVQIRGTALACAVQRYKIKYGKLPGTLKTLVPEFIKEVPKSPFTGKDLQYIKAGADFSINCEISEYEKRSSANYRAGEIFGTKPRTMCQCEFCKPAKTSP